MRALEQLRADGIVAFDLAWAAKLMASYTGVLLSATAIPVWYTGRRHILDPRAYLRHPE